jgi:hypothetical protein
MFLRKWSVTNSQMISSAPMKIHIPTIVKKDAIKYRRKVENFIAPIHCARELRPCCARAFFADF